MADGSNISPENPSTRFGRRGFLKLGAVALGVAAAGSLTLTFPQVKEAPLELTSFTTRELIKNPNHLNRFLRVTSQVMDTFVLHDKRPNNSPQIRRNESYRPMSAIVSQAVENYIHRGGAITYQRHPMWQEDRYYIDKFATAMEHDARDSIKLPVNSSVGALVEALSGIGDRTVELYYKTVPGSDEYADVMQNQTYWGDSKDESNPDKMVSLPEFFGGSSLYDEVVEQLGVDVIRANQDPERIGPPWKIIYKDKRLVSVVRNYFKQIEDFTTAAVQENEGRPISAGVILEHLLSKNSGSLDKSLVDLALFLQYKARGQKPLDANVEQWFVSNILDEYGKVINYASLSEKRYQYRGLLPSDLMTPDRDQDLSRVNQIGKPYHAWSIISKLSGLPPVMLKLGTLNQNINDFPKQGFAKISSDLHIASELDTLDKLVARFQV